MPRQPGIDALRYPMLFAVVILHTISESRTAATPDWPAFLEMACRAAVPFFFIAAGYFLRPQESDWQTVAKPCLKLLPPYVAWKLAYLAILSAAAPGASLFTPRRFLANAPAYHLWFLPALAIGLILVPLALKYLHWHKTVLLCAGLAVLSLMFGAYHDALSLPGHISWARQLIAPAYVLIGVWLSGRRLDPKPRHLAMLVLAGMLALVGEEYLFKAFAHRAHLASDEFLGSTFLYGTAIFLAFRLVPVTVATGFLAGFGKMGLHIYAVHLLFVWMFLSLAGHPALPWALLLTVPAFFAATLVGATIAAMAHRFAVPARN